MLADGVVEGRRIFANTIKYVLMGTSSYGGYAGFFTDPDGHVWEIAYNPGFALDRDGAITLPAFGGSQDNGWVRLAASTRAPSIK